MELYKHSELTEAIINAFFHVYKTLGYGFLEKVYRNALVIELQKRNHVVKQSVEIKIRYDGIVVGEYFADLIVDDCVIVELKAVEAIARSTRSSIIELSQSHQLGGWSNIELRPQS